MVKIAKRINQLEYAIREIAVRVEKLEKSGKEVIKLHIGDPLKFDFEVPEPFKAGLAKHADKGFYGPSKGVEELIEAVAEWERAKGIEVDAEKVYITQGLGEAIMFLLGAVVERGDRVLLPRPVYPLYANFTRFFGGEPVFYSVLEESEEEVKEKMKGVKAAVLINPSNPAGVVHSKEFVKAMVDLSEDYRVPLIADEIYDKIWFDRKPVNAAKFGGEYTITLNGFSKAFLAPGYRVGYVYFNGLEELEDAFFRFLRTRLSGNVPAQYAAAEAMREGGSWIPELREKLKKRRDVAYSKLRELFEVEKPEGAFYIFPKLDKYDDWSFAIKLLEEKHVAVVPGSGFEAPDYFRMVFLPREEIIEEAVERMGELL